ncbi:PilZ domain-containing protein, partial [bacterium]|nr:PilZ domain-containing protein [bacterium]
ANSEYVLLDSATESGVKVQDVLNISKQGMLVQTDGKAQVGENIAITMDYKGLPFTVEGTVVRTDAAKGTAGIQFNNIDQFTSSMILYLGMMNGMK